MIEIWFTISGNDHISITIENVPEYKIHLLESLPSNQEKCWFVVQPLPLVCLPRSISNRTSGRTAPTSTPSWSRRRARMRGSGSMSTSGTGSFLHPLLLTPVDQELWVIVLMTWDVVGSLGRVCKQTSLSWCLSWDYCLARNTTQQNVTDASRCLTLQLNMFSPRLLNLYQIWLISSKHNHF